MRAIIFIALFLFSFLNNSLSWNIESLDKASTSQLSLNLVFCSLGYSNNKDFSRDIEILLERLNKIKPFDEFMNVMGVWQIDILKDEEKDFFKETQGFPPLKLRQDFLDGILAHPKSNYKLIIIDATGSVSCAELSSKDKMSLIILGKRRYKDKNSFTKGFLHELGHSLGLRDEGLNSEAALCLPGPPNCAATKEEAQKWWGDFVGKVARVNYVRGCCGNKDYIRPVIASLMNDADKADDFGPVNERYLRRVLEEGLYDESTSRK